MYRPWGPLVWTLSRSTAKDWHFVGCIGTTERSICSWSTVKSHTQLRGEHFLQIQDVDSEKYRDATRFALEARMQQFVQLGGNNNMIIRLPIMAELFRILEFARTCAPGASSVILDITALPKRFFFPILRFLVQSTHVRDLVITYTSPAGYPEDAPLYEDVESWRPLPGFANQMPHDEHWIVTVGFLVESLRQYLGDNPDHEKMKLLIPYPAPVGSLRRVWASIAQLEGGQLEGSSRFEKYRVDTLDMSSSFDLIASYSQVQIKASSDWSATRCPHHWHSKRLTL